MRLSMATRLEFKARLCGPMQQFWNDAKQPAEILIKRRNDTPPPLSSYSREITRINGPAKIMLFQGCYSGFEKFETRFRRFCEFFSGESTKSTEF